MHTEPPPNADTPRLSLGHLGGFLLGREDSIRAVAGARGSLLLGLLFVFSAALAREYDGEPLLYEPQHLVIPLAASLLTATLLYLLLMLTGAAPWREALPGWGRFLACYWFTAPLAWLYAIPVERMFEPEPAVKANLALLGIVAAWRVVLITRVASVLFAKSWLRIFPVVLLFADLVALQLLAIIPRPIVGMMGGIRHSAAEQALLDTILSVQILGFLSLPIWFFGSCIAAGLNWRRPADHEDREPATAGPATPLSLWLLAATALLFFSALLPFNQPPQMRKWEVEQLLKGGQVEAGLRLMSSQPRDTFPPHWDPPPRLGYGEDRPGFDELLRGLAAADAADWVWELYLEKLLFHGVEPFGRNRFTSWQPEELERFAAAVSDERFAGEERDELVEQIGRKLSDRWHGQPELTETGQAALLRALSHLGAEPPPERAD